MQTPSRFCPPLAANALPKNCKRGIKSNLDCTVLSNVGVNWLPKNCTSLFAMMFESMYNVCENHEIELERRVT